jgi:hypothetical protein
MNKIKLIVPVIILLVVAACSNTAPLQYIIYPMNYSYDLKVEFNPDIKTINAILIASDITLKTAISENFIEIAKNHPRSPYDCITTKIYGSLTTHIRSELTCKSKIKYINKCANKALTGKCDE